MKVADEGDSEAEDEEGARSQDKDQNAIALDELVVEEGAASQNFTDRTDDGQGDGKANAHANTIEDGVTHGVFAGESLGPAQHDT